MGPHQLGEPRTLRIGSHSAKIESPADLKTFRSVAGLDDFDPSDRKFVAVANAHPEKPPILEALDSKWWGWRDALSAAGITVLFLCETEVKETYERKFPERVFRPGKPRRD